MVNENYTLLVVDDNQENRDILSRRLENSGYKTIVAKDGQEAFNILNENTIHLVLLDIMMPEVDGITLLSTIRDDNAFDDMPVIMVTAVDIVNVAQDCLVKGACGYITKPYDFNLIKQKIRLCLKLEP